MKCLFLAAGYATRLYPLTENFPKPLLDVNKKSILDWMLDDLRNIKVIDEFIIVSNHKYVNHFNDWKNNHTELNITIIDDFSTDNENRLGAVKDIELAVNKLNINDDLMVLAGDNLVDFSFKNFVNYFNEKKHSCVMRYEEQDVNSLKKRSILFFEKNDLISEMIEKPDNPNSNWCCPPFYIVAKDDLNLISLAINDGCKTDAPGSLISYMCKKTLVFAYEMPGKRYDIGDLKSYQEICSKYESK